MTYDKRLESVAAPNNQRDRKRKNDQQSNPAQRQNIHNAPSNPRNIMTSFFTIGQSGDR